MRRLSSKTKPLQQTIYLFYQCTLMPYFVYAMNIYLYTYKTLVSNAFKK